MIDINCVVAENKYGKYAVPKASEHRPACQMILKGEVYEPDTIQYMLDNGGDGVIITAGTFFGDFLPALGTLPNKIYAFEPVTDSYQHALTTLDLNFEEHNIELRNCGLGSESDTRDIKVSDIHGTNLGGGALYGRYKDVSKDMLQETQIVTLDETVVDHTNVSIIQLDVEGFEEQALKGALDIIEKSHPILILEMWGENRLKTPFFVDEIFGKGYTKTGDLHDNVVLEYKNS